MLLRLSAILNNSIKYSSIALAPIEVLYRFYIRELLDFLRIEDLDTSQDPTIITLNQSEQDLLTAIIVVYPITRNTTR